ncbi:RNA polymerase sigma factor RpoD/SigA [Ruoffia sp. FAM 26255]|uniref:sigma-70 family RNA polymerase sigma factor n=1 Tax=Ruoffia sp. FAM 26255 TaxID=3259519 RepID=UPI00388620AD
MSGNLDLIVDYIYDNFRYGSKLTESKINLLFQKYPLPDKQKEIVQEELRMLNITIISDEKKARTLFNELCFLIGEPKEYRESLLIKWYEDNNVEHNKRDEIRRSLNEFGYSIINDVPKEIDKSKFNFLNDLDLKPLDTQLDSDDFNEKLEKMKSPVHSDYNLDYLNSLHSEHSGYDQKQKSLDNLVEANINLVWKVVDRYEGAATQSFDSDDMFQHGMMGLIKAAEKFDLSKETQFSTYAVYWIRQSITRAIMDFSRTIRIPVHMRERINKMRRVKGQLKSYLKREPLAEEIGAEMDLLTSEVYEIILLSQNEVSLDTPIGSEQDSFLGDFIKDDSNDLPNEKVMKNSLKEEISDVLNKFTEREREIINKRFGLQDQEEKTLEELGQVYGVTRERIRQIESKTLKRLRHSTVRDRLRDYYEDQ